MDGHPAGADAEQRVGHGTRRSAPCRNAETAIICEEALRLIRWSGRSSPIVDRATAWPGAPRPIEPKALACRSPLGMSRPASAKRTRCSNSTDVVAHGLPHPEPERELSPGPRFRWGPLPSLYVQGIPTWGPTDRCSAYGVTFDRPTAAPPSRGKYCD